MEQGEGHARETFQYGRPTSAGGGDEYYQEPDFPEYRYLLFVDKFDRPDDVRTRLAPLPKWRFLYRSVVE